MKKNSPAFKTKHPGYMPDLDEKRIKEIIAGVNAGVDQSDVKELRSVLIFLAQRWYNDRERLESVRTAIAMIEASKEMGKKGVENLHETVGFKPDCCKFEGPFQMPDGYEKRTGN